MSQFPLILAFQIRKRKPSGTAFSAYSGVLKLAVAALDKSEPGSGYPPMEEYPAYSEVEKAAG